MSMLTLGPSALFVNHQGQPGGAGPSPRIWGWIQGQMGAPDGCSIVHKDEDGFNFMDSDGYEAVGTFAESTTEEGGVVTSSDQEAYLSRHGGQGKIDDTADNLARFTAFEARVKLASVSTTVFAGLATPSIAAANALTATTVADNNFIGAFHRQADAGQVGLLYRKAGQAAQIKSYQASQASTPVLTAGNWHKIGWTYRPGRNFEGGRIRTYIDNILCAELVTEADMAATTFPANTVLAPFIGFHGAAATANSVDWFYFVQTRK